MKVRKFIITFAVLLTLVLAGCSSYPIDENGLLITTRTSSYMTMFDLLDESHTTVIIGTAVLDTLALDSITVPGTKFIQPTVKATVKYGTNLKNLKPYCAVAQDCIVTPTMGVWTDFSDFTNPKTYTVISGNRQVKKTYKVIINVLPKP